MSHLSVNLNQNYHTAFDFNESLFGPENRKIPTPIENDILLEAALTAGAVGGSLLLTSMLPVTGGLGLLVAQAMLGSVGGVIGSEIISQALKIVGCETYSIYDSLAADGTVTAQEAVIAYGGQIVVSGIQSLVIGRVSRLWSRGVDQALLANNANVRTLGRVASAVSGKSDWLVEKILGQSSSAIGRVGLRFVKEFTQEETENFGRRFGVAVGGERAGWWIENGLAIINGGARRTNFLHLNETLLPDFSQVTIEDFAEAATAELGKLSSQIDALDRTFGQPGFQANWDSVIGSTQTVLMTLLRVDKLCDLAKREHAFKMRLANDYDPSQFKDEKEYQKKMEEVNGIYATIAMRISQKYEAVAARLHQSGSYYQALQTLRGVSGLSPEQQFLVDQRLLKAREKGAHLSPEQKERVNQIQARLIELESTHESNGMAAVKMWAVKIEDESQLAGVNEAIKNKWKKVEGSKAYWEVVMNNATYVEVMENCSVRATRETVYKNYWCRVSDMSPEIAGSAAKDNAPLLKEMIVLRNEYAKIMGEENYAAYVMKYKSSFGDVTTARGFLTGLLDALQPAVKSQWDNVRETAARLDGIPTDEVKAWDVKYYAIKSASADPDTFNPGDYHFPMTKLREQAFSVAREQIGVEISPVENINPWDPALTTYEVKSAKTGEVLGRFIWDAFNRPGKVQQPQAIELVKGVRAVDGNLTTVPLALLHTNYSQLESGGQESNLSVREAEITFHELGHILHMLTGSRPYPELSGAEPMADTSDMVEFPSKTFENFFLKDAQTMANIAVHKTNGTSPDVDKVSAYLSKPDPQLAFMTSFSASTALSDILMHSGRFPDKSPLDIDVVVMGHYLPYANDTIHNRINIFGHFANVGYASRYYQYSFAEILGRTIYSRIRSSGDASFFRDALSTGSALPPAQLLSRVFGRNITEFDFSEIPAMFGF